MPATRSLAMGAAITLGLLSRALQADPPDTSGRAPWCVPTVAGVPEPETLCAPGAWPEASTLTGFCGLSGRQLSRSQPVFWVARDAARLMVGWRVPRLDRRPFARQVSDHDGPLWNDDSVEVFLDPGHTHTDYLQFMANANGAQTEARGRDLSWNGQWDTRTAETDEAWARSADRLDRRQCAPLSAPAAACAGSRRPAGEELQRVADGSASNPGTQSDMGNPGLRLVPVRRRGGGVDLWWGNGGPILLRRFAWHRRPRRWNATAATRETRVRR